MKQAEIASMVADRDVLFLELRRLWPRDAEGPGGSGTGHRPHPINSRLGSTLLAPLSPPPPIFGLIGVPMPTSTAAKGSTRAPTCRDLPPSVGCPPFQAGGKQTARGTPGGLWGGADPGSRHPHLFSFEPCGANLQGRAMGSRPPCDRAPRRGAGGGGASPGPCPLPPAAGRASFFCVVVVAPPGPPLSPPCRGTRRSSRRFLAAMKCTKWKFNRPVVCVVEISGSCFGIFYDTFVYVGEA